MGQAAKAKPHNLRLRQKQVVVLEIVMLIDMNADAYVDAADDCSFSTHLVTFM